MLPPAGPEEEADDDLPITLQYLIIRGRK